MSRAEGIRLLRKEGLILWERSSALLDAANLGEWIVSIIVITVVWAVQSIIRIETEYIDRGIRDEKRDYKEDGMKKFAFVGVLFDG